MPPTYSFDALPVPPCVPFVIPKAAASLIPFRLIPAMPPRPCRMPELSDNTALVLVTPIWSRHVPPIVPSLTPATPPATVISASLPSLSLAVTESETCEFVIVPLLTPVMPPAAPTVSSSPALPVLSPFFIIVVASSPVTLTVLPSVVTPVISPPSLRPAIAPAVSCPVKCDE